MSLVWHNCKGYCIFTQSVKKARYGVTKGLNGLLCNGLKGYIIFVHRCIIYNFQLRVHFNALYYNVHPLLQFWSSPDLMTSIKICVGEKLQTLFEWKTMYCILPWNYETIFQRRQSQVKLFSCSMVNQNVKHSHTRIFQIT